MSESNGGTIHGASNYPDLLPEIPRYSCLVEIFFYFYKVMTEI